MLRDRDDPQNYIVITAWQSVADWERYEKVPETSKIHAKIEKLMARRTKVKICVHA
jgi:heme-degrading monooxygenase HmoA